MLKNKWRGTACGVFELPRFINDNVATHLSYLRKYGEYRITVETLNRPFVLPHSTSSRCLSSVHTICQAFWTSEIVSFDPTGRHSCANLAVQYSKNVLYYNFEPSIRLCVFNSRKERGMLCTSIHRVFLYSSVWVSNNDITEWCVKLNIASYLCEISIIMGPCRNSIVWARYREKREGGIVAT